MKTLAVELCVSLYFQSSTLLHCLLCPNSRSLTVTNIDLPAVKNSILSLFFATWKETQILRINVCHMYDYFVLFFHHVLIDRKMAIIVVYNYAKSVFELLSDMPIN